MLQAKQPRRKKVEEDGTKEGSYAPYIQQLEGGLCGGIGWTDSDNKRELWEDINQRRDQLIRYLRRHWSGCCPTLSDAEDILQMTCMRLIANGEDGLVRDSWAWIIGALRNTCLSETRNARRRDALSLTANLPWILGETSPDVAERVILRDVLDKAFSLVREPYRDLLARQFVEGYTLRDLASMSGIPRSTLERHLTEAMDLVSAYLVAEGVLSPHALEPQREQLPVFDQLEQVLTSIGMTAPSMPWADGKTETVKRSS
jgi:RNA polymerase sigma factor (sigma-70 family)